MHIFLTTFFSRLQSFAGALPDESDISEVEPVFSRFIADVRHGAPLPVRTRAVNDINDGPDVTGGLSPRDFLAHSATDGFRRSFSLKWVYPRLKDGVEFELIPGGSVTSVDFESRLSFCDMVVARRLAEYSEMVSLFGPVLVVKRFRLFLWLLDLKAQSPRNSFEC